MNRALRALARPPRYTRHSAPRSPYDTRGRYRAYARFRYAQRRRERVLAETWFFALTVGLLVAVFAALWVAGSAGQ